MIKALYQIIVVAMAEPVLAALSTDAKSVQEGLGALEMEEVYANLGANNFLAAEGTFSQTDEEQAIC